MFASTNDEKANEPSNEIIAKENLEINNGDISDKQEEIVEVSQNPALPVAPNQDKDSTNINSVCKFNYIFYFIYKLKYDDNGENTTGYIDYEF